MSTPIGRSVLVSVGYENRSIDELVEVLVSEGVDVLIDVRLNAISRKKGFSKTALSTALADAGIQYRHERILGNPKDNRDPFRKRMPAARDRYRRLLSDDAADVVEDIVALAVTERVALLCFEREHDECHRSCIVDSIRDANPSADLVTV